MRGRVLLATLGWSLLEKPIAALDLVNPTQAPWDKQILTSDTHISSPFVSVQAPSAIGTGLSRLGLRGLAHNVGGLKQSRHRLSLFQSQ